MLPCLAYLQAAQRVLGASTPGVLVYTRSRARSARMIELVREVGRGSFGFVYLARRQVVDHQRQLVAVKFPKSGDSLESRAEFEMLRACAHPGVVVGIELLEGQALQKITVQCKKYKAALVMEAAVSDLASFLEAQGPCLDAGLAKDWSRTLGLCLGDAALQRHHSSRR